MDLYSSDLGVSSTDDLLNANPSFSFTADNDLDLDSLFDSDLGLFDHDQSTGGIFDSTTSLDWPPAPEQEFPEPGFSSGPGFPSDEPPQVFSQSGDFVVSRQNQISATSHLLPIVTESSQQNQNVPEKIELDNSGLTTSVITSATSASSSATPQIKNCPPLSLPHPGSDSSTPLTYNYHTPLTPSTSQPARVNPPSTPTKFLHPVSSNISKPPHLAPATPPKPPYIAPSTPLQHTVVRRLRVSVPATRLIALAPATVTSNRQISIAPSNTKITLSHSNRQIACAPPNISASSTSISPARQFAISPKRHIILAPPQSSSTSLLSSLTSPPNHLLPIKRFTPIQQAALTSPNISTTSVPRIILTSMTNMSSASSAILTSLPRMTNSTSSTSSSSIASPSSTTTCQTLALVRPGPHKGEVVVADSTSGRSSSYRWVPCRVCGDKASGYHYGVTSCEGCKGFFRRSIQRSMEYRCLREGKCLVIRLNRNRCQFCRFNKCLQVGMSRESVRYGRVPKKAKEEEEREGSEEERKCQLVSSLRSAHEEHCPTPLAAATRPLVAEGDGDSARLNMFQKVVTRLTPQIQGVVEFAKRIPGFNLLPTDDQLVLVKHGVLEAWLVGMAAITPTTTPALVTTMPAIHGVVTTTPSLHIAWPDGTYIDKDGVEALYGAELAEGLWEVRDRLAGIGKDEAALLAGLALLDGGRPGLQDTASVEASHGAVMDGLQRVLGEAGRPGMAGRLAEELGRIKEVAALHGVKLGWFRDRTNAVPPLFAEIFDFSKDEGSWA